MIVHDRSMDTQLQKIITTQSIILWYATTRGKKVGTYKVHKNLPNTDHVGESTEKADTGNSAATSVSTNTNAYTTDEYSRAPSVSY